MQILSIRKKELGDSDTKAPKLSQYKGQDYDYTISIDNTNYALIYRVRLTDRELYWVWEDPQYGYFVKFKKAFDNALQKYMFENVVSA